MPLPDKNIFTQNLLKALNHAKDIAVRAAADPSLYLNDEIQAWADMNCTSRLFCSKAENVGQFDKFELAAFEELKARFPGSVYPPIRTDNFSAEATGEAKGSLAVLNHINGMYFLFSPDRISEFYDRLGAAFQNGQAMDAYYAYQGLFLSAEFDLTVLYNTMMNKMEKGNKPLPIPGPGQHLVQTNFGAVIVDDIPRKLMDLTVDEYFAIMDSRYVRR